MAGDEPLNSSASFGTDEADSAVAAVTKPKTSSNADKAAALAALVCEEMKLSGKVDAVRKALNNEVKNLVSSSNSSIQLFSFHWENIRQN